MQKSQKILIGIGAGVLAFTVATAVAGPVIYRDLIQAPAAETPHLGANPDLLGAIEVPLQAAELAGAWEISDGSEAGYRVDEVLGGTDVTVTGRTSEVSGSLSVDETGTVLDAADIAVNVGSVATDNASRDAYFHDRVMRVSEFPTATFTLTSPVSLTPLPTTGEVAQTRATGDLTLAGVTKTVTVTLSVRSDGETAEIAGAIPVDFADFGIEAPSLSFVRVEPSGSVEFQLVATR